MNSELLSDLELLLQRRLDIIADHELRDSNPGKQLDQLQEVSEALSVWFAQHEDQVDPRLHHFLDGCSYNKALTYIREGRSVPCSV